MTAPPITAPYLLGKARRYMKRHGWCQHALMDEKGRVCLLGALEQASKDNGAASFPNALAHGALEQIAYRRGANSPAKLNDVFIKTKKEAMEALEDAERLAAKIIVNQLKESTAWPKH